MRVSADVRANPARRRDRYRVALIGFGAIGRAVAGFVRDDPTLRNAWSIAGVMTRTATPCEGAIQYQALQELLDARPDVVVECAGHEAVRLHAEAVLREGLPLAILSVGALVDDGLRERLHHASIDGGSRLSVLAGAVSGIEGLAAAKVAGLRSVTCISTKPPAAWRGSAAEACVDLDALDMPTIFFDGSAREAAGQYPRNANVAAAVAFAGIGLDATRVQLIADPGARGNRHHVEARGDAGSWRLEIESAPTGNVRSSALAAMSVVRFLRSTSDVFGV